MLRLKTLRWSNILSYGEDNTLDLGSNKIVHLKGLTGHGKTSIPIILQEAIVGRNAKKLKKSSLFSWNSNENRYQIEVEFLLNDLPGKLSVTRVGAKLKVSLVYNGEDLSRHKSTDTYKFITESLLGIDPDIFINLTYLSPKESLAFLEDTDTNRKKFLVKLLKQDHYEALAEEVKIALSKVQTQIASEKGAIAGAKEAISTLQSADLEVPDTNINEEDIEKSLSELELSREGLVQQLADIEESNKRHQELKSVTKKIASLSIQLTQLKGQLMDVISLPEPPETVPFNEENRLALESWELSSVKDRIQEVEASIHNIEQNKVELVCSKCGSDLNQETALELQEKELEALRQELQKLNSKKSSLNKVVEVLKKAKLKHDKEQKRLRDNYSEKLKLRDNCIRSNRKIMEQVSANEALADDYNERAYALAHFTYTDPTELKSKLKTITAKITRARTLLSDVKAAKQKAARAIEDKAKLAAITEKLNKKESLLESLEEDFNNLSILKEAFSYRGLIGFKLEASARALETRINDYMYKFSEGLFRVKLRVKGDKLPVTILNSQGEEIEVGNLSNGQRAWLNISTMLAIRSLLAKISGTHINVLFLDELTGMFDEENKTKFLDILLDEDDLNIFVMAHDFSHPLMKTAEVIMEDGISRIENG